MHTIWFCYHNSSTALNVKVTALFAPQVWDKLNEEFRMLSTRP